MYKRDHLTGIMAVALAMAPLAAGAQQALDLGNITVSANLADTALDRTGTSVIVVSGTELRKAGDILVGDFLNRLPGISVNSNGPIGTKSGISVRGANQNYVKVYIDGIDVTDPSGTQVAYDFGGLTTADIARIEILKGSQSALYGGQAVGGVINITTRRADKGGTRQSATLEYGSYNTARAGYRISRRNDRYAVSLGISRITTDGFSAADANNGNTEPDGHQQTAIDFSGQLFLSDRLTLGLSGFATSGRTAFDDFVGGAIPYGDGTPDDFVTRQTTGLRATARLRSAGLDSSFNLTSYRIKRHYTGTSSASVPYDWRYQGMRKAASYKGIVELSQFSTLVFGADYTREYYYSDTGFGPTAGNTSIGGAYLQWLSAPSDRLDISTALRMDRHSSFGDFPTGRLTVAWRPDGATVLRAAAYTGFRAPSFNELFGPFGGNPALKPEQSRGLELGIERRLAGDMRISATAFVLNVTDLIQYSWPAGYAQVPGTSRRQGIEMTFSAPLGKRVNLSANYTYTDGRDASGAQLSRVPRHDLTVSLAAMLSARLKGTLDWQFVAGRVDGGASMPDYAVANASLGYDMGEQTQLYLRIDNLFNAQYETVRYYGTSDRAIHVGLRRNF